MSGKENKIQCDSGAKKPLEPTEKDPNTDGFLKMPVAEEMETEREPMTASQLKRGIGSPKKNREEEKDRDLLIVSTIEYPYQTQENVEALNKYRGVDREMALDLLREYNLKEAIKNRQKYRILKDKKPEASSPPKEKGSEEKALSTRNDDAQSQGKQSSEKKRDVAKSDSVVSEAAAPMKSKARGRKKTTSSLIKTPRQLVKAEIVKAPSGRKTKKSLDSEQILMKTGKMMLRRKRRQNYNQSTVSSEPARKKGKKEEDPDYEFDEEEDDDY
ncbi:hypothetical protein B9Z55_023841 [Caenorhabditis nigoni]|uniref:Uncharacterized protein n=2 Tax=Caenorhabditis nigoni TaxID=1611254 RepID=A0A2G5SRH3_9PELO|nr:hypothetical protein B9Z55_023841 [Caenorhabditis nigoni]